MMNKHTPLKASGSLLERAAEIYDFRKSLRGPALPEVPEASEREERGEVREREFQAPAPAPEPDAELELQAEESLEASTERPRRRKQPIIMSEVEVSFGEPEPAEAAPAADPKDDFMEPEPAPQPAPKPSPATAAPAAPAGQGKVDRERLREGGFILPDAPVTGLAEEFRIIKRQLLQGASGKTGIRKDKRQTILVCSASPDEGKTFCAVNLALSMSTEKDVEVLLVDGDFSKPEILSTLGLKGGPGLIDAIADPSTNVNSFVIQTDINRLSVLPAGRQANNVPELLGSERTRGVLDALTEGQPRRIVIFDSPPALMASPASILASKVGQAVMVVRADKTNEADLREAVGLLSGCDNLSLMLNGAGFAATGRRFGSYYGYGQ